MAQFEKLTAPTQGTPIRFENGQPVVANDPIIPFIRGDGTGVDIWPATQKVLDAAIAKAYGGAKRWTILFASFGFLFNMLTVFALYLDELFLARMIFGSCCLSMIISILFFIREIHISTNALKLHMSDMDVDVS